jgi:hypothetical protein
VRAPQLVYNRSCDVCDVRAPQLDFFNGPQADQFSSVQKKLDDVKNVMVQNIEMVLERGEKLELLVDKSEQLQARRTTMRRRNDEHKRDSRTADKQARFRFSSLFSSQSSSVEPASDHH